MAFLFRVPQKGPQTPRTSTIILTIHRYWAAVPSLLQSDRFQTTTSAESQQHDCCDCLRHATVRPADSRSVRLGGLLVFVWREILWTLESLRDLTKFPTNGNQELVSPPWTSNGVAGNTFDEHEGTHLLNVRPRERWAVPACGSNKRSANTYRLSGGTRGRHASSRYP